MFITGAAAGIGRATALLFARNGYRIGAYDIDLAGLESLRAVEGLETAARLAAMLAGRDRVAVEDLVLAAPLVLAHRTDNVTLAGILKQLQSADGRQEARGRPDTAESQPGSKRPTEAVEADPAVTRWRQWLRHTLNAAITSCSC